MTTPHEAAAQRRAEATAQRADRPRQRRAAADPTSGKPRMSLPLTRAEVRESDDGSRVTFRGVASATEQPYEVWDWAGPYMEVMDARAFDATLAREDLDVPLVLGHDSLRRIARTTNGTLRLSTGDEGLIVEADLDMRDADTAYIVPKIRAGLIDEMSFMFRIEAGQWSPDYTEYRVTQTDIHRGDVAIVGYGANPFTSSEVESPARQDADAGIQARDESSAAPVALGDDLPAEPPIEREESVPMDETTQELAAEVVEREQVDVEALVARIAELENQSTIRAAAKEAPRTMSIDTPKYDEVARVGAESRTYNPESDPIGGHFLRDFAGAHLGDYDARDRIARHSKEERIERAAHTKRDVGTGQFAGLTIPQYLVDLVAPAMRAARPLADNARKLTLPADGMTVAISRITTGTSAAAQTAEAAAVSETDIDDTALTVDVRTIAGQQDVSFQALARSVGAEEVILRDLVAAYHTALDSQIINGTGANGQHLGIRNVVSVSTATLTDASPTPSEAIGSLYAIQSTIEAATFKVPTHLVMAPRRWHWFRAAVGSDVMLIGQGTAYPPQPGDAANGSPYGSGVRGDLAGLPVIVDGSIPLTVGGGTEDVILCVNTDELFLWEEAGAPVYLRADQPGAGNLMSKLVVYGYSAFTAGRYPAAQGVISGSGLAAPSTFGKAIS